MWLEGYQIPRIAEAVGVSTQRVYHLRVRFPDRQWATKKSLGKLAREGAINRWIRQGHVRESPDGLVQRQDVVKRYIELVERRCQYPECSEPIGSIREQDRFCGIHSVEVRRYAYPIMSEERKKKAQAAVEHWKVLNPEAARAIRQRAVDKFRARQQKERSEG
jgi:hypothetical protein